MKQKIIIAIGNDHSASTFKLPIIQFLKDNHYDFIDFGTNNTIPVDYPDYGFQVAEAVTSGKAHFGIVICGTGIGVSIAANRNSHARCALVYEEETAKLARQHNNANIIALGARIIAPEKAVNLVEVFLSTPASKEIRHEKRVEKLSNLKDVNK